LSIIYRRDYIYDYFVFYFVKPLYSYYRNLNYDFENDYTNDYYIINFEKTVFDNCGYFFAGGPNDRLFLKLIVLISLNAFYRLK